MLNLPERPRRLRSLSSIRDLVSETRLDLTSLIQPYFVSSRKIDSELISGFGDVSRWGQEALLKRVEQDLERGVRSFLLFGETHDKDATGKHSADIESVIPQTLRRLKSEFGSTALLFTDVCLCPYTSHGHCGVWDGKQVANDASVELLSQMALAHAQAGADFVAPSDMMDGRVGFLRKTLDQAGYDSVGILAYTAKYASQYYGPFREALGSSPEAGSDRSGYQMDFRNSRDALRELRLDVAEGADMVMVKPALAYLDIVAEFRRHSDVPVVAYSVSGEYQAVKLMAKEGLADERRLALENLTAMRRAGATAIITYFTSRIAEEGWLR